MSLKKTRVADLEEKLRDISRASFWGMLCQQRSRCIQEFTVNETWALTILTHEVIQSDSGCENLFRIT